VNKYLAGKGDVIELGTVLGRGGEGTIFSIQNNNNLAVKMYSPHLAAERRAKISNMVSAKLHTSASFVAYPIDTVTNNNGAFCGFTMRVMPSNKHVHQLYSPTGRKTTFPRATFPMLVRTAANIARAVHNVHSSGCIIGDINHSGFLVSDDATVVLVDSDSFQFSYNGTVYPCKVGVPEFTPPELQGKDLSKIIRTANHDNFGLSVLIFYTLMMGRHPFAGRYLGQGDMPMDRAIAQCRFAYSARRTSTLMEPPPNVQTLSDLPLGLGDAFERAFGPSGATGARPSASEWISIIEKAEGELVQCATSSAHHYFRNAKSCPWCRMERAYPGFVAFVPVFPVHPGHKPLDLGQLVSAVRAIKDPGPAPDLAAMMPAAVSPPPNGKWAGMRRRRFYRWVGGVIGVTIAAFLLTFEPVGPLLALVAITMSALVVFLVPTEIKEERKKLRGAKEAWGVVQRDFEQGASNSYFLHLRNEAEKLIARLQQLSSEESSRLANLTKKNIELQLRRFLEQHDIDHVRIRGIGNSRKLTLKSYGIETAADIDYHKISAISGFGPATATVLLDWRKRVEAKFHFNPSQSIHPTDLNAIKIEFANKRADPEARARQTLDKLQKAAANAVAARASPGSQASDAWLALKRAQVFEQSIRPSRLDAAKLFGIVVICLVSVLLYTTIKNPSALDHLRVNQSGASKEAPLSAPKSLGVSAAPTVVGSLRPSAENPRTTSAPKATPRTASPPAATSSVGQSGIEKPPSIQTPNSVAKTTTPLWPKKEAACTQCAPSVLNSTAQEGRASPPGQQAPSTQKTEASKDRDNFRTCISGNYPSLCKHDLLSLEEAAQAAAAEKRVNFQTCISGNYPSLCKHDVLTREEAAQAAAAEKRVNFQTCISGNYPSLCKHDVLTREEAAQAAAAEKRVNFQTCISGNYPSLCKHDLLSLEEAFNVSEAERRAKSR
jgi:DNA-binding helix-hairpin-helix protein with protein kinase domain